MLAPAWVAGGAQGGRRGCPSTLRVAAGAPTLLATPAGPCVGWGRSLDAQACGRALKRSPCMRCGARNALARACCDLQPRLPSFHRSRPSGRPQLATCGPGPATMSAGSQHLLQAGLLVAGALLGWLARASQVRGDRGQLLSHAAAQALPPACRLPPAAASSLPPAASITLPHSSLLQAAAANTTHTPLLTSHHRTVTTATAGQSMRAMRRERALPPPRAAAAATAAFEAAPRRRPRS